VTAGWRGRKAALMAIMVLCCSALTWAAHVGLRPYLEKMKFSITGVNHRSAPVEVRERLAFRRKAVFRTRLDNLKSRPGICEGMILSTCNRVEVALACEESANGEAAVDAFLADTRHVDREWVRRYLYRYNDRDAIRHLFRVAVQLGFHGRGRAANPGPTQERLCSS
jgi:hypothetical protein